MKILVIVGKRSEIIKTAPIIEELSKNKIPFSLVDVQEQKGWFMKGSHFLDLDYPSPDFTVKFDANSFQSLVSDLADIMCEEEPDCVISSGASETTCAAVLASNLLKIPFVHIEAGYRTYDLTSRAEIRREVIDALSTYCFAPTRSAFSNLLIEGFNRSRVFLSGSTVIDSLTKLLDFARTNSQILEELDLENEPYCLITIHKPENITENRMRVLLEVLQSVDCYFVMPTHPNTHKLLKESGIYDDFMSLENLLMIEPLGYVDFLALEYSSQFVITDSGTVMEESAFLGKPVVFVGIPERRELIEQGISFFSELNKKEILIRIKKAREAKVSRSKIYRIFGYGNASEKIVDQLNRIELHYSPKIGSEIAGKLINFRVISVSEPLNQLRERFGSKLLTAVRDRKLITDPKISPSHILIIESEN